MTAVTERAPAPSEAPLIGEPSLGSIARTPATPTDDRTSPTSRRVAAAIAAWVVTTLVGIVLVLIIVGPLMLQRDQRALLGRYRTEIREASNEAFGLPGIEASTTAPATGDPVGIVDLGRTGLRQVVVEGSGPQQTRRGPGHVVGTAGPGQPGNSVVVGRRALFGGALADLDELRLGDRILVTTVQGPSVYEVAHVGSHQIVASTEGTSPSTTRDAASPDVSASSSEGPVLPPRKVGLDQLYGPTADDRLTLVTSASGVPWGTDEAVVVVAVMDGLPFGPTPQGGRTEEGDGRGGDPNVIAPLLLSALAYTATLAATVVLYRRAPWRSAYLLSAPLLVACTIVLAEQVGRALPAWS